MGRAGRERATADRRVTLRMAATRSLALRLAAAGFAYLTIAVASIGLSLWVTWQLEGGAAAVNEAGRLRMLTYRMAMSVAAGRQAEIPALMGTFERTLSGPQQQRRPAQHEGGGVPYREPVRARLILEPPEQECH